MKNPNQDLIDLIHLNDLEEKNENSLVPGSEKSYNALCIERAKRERMNRLRRYIPIPVDNKDRLGNDLSVKD